MRTSLITGGLLALTALVLLTIHGYAPDGGTPRHCHFAA